MNNNIFIKILSFTCLAMVVILQSGSGCPGGGGNRVDCSSYAKDTDCNGKDKDGNDCVWHAAAGVCGAKGQKYTVRYSVLEWKELPGKVGEYAPTDNEIKMIAVSGDRNLYAVGKDRKELFRADLSGGFLDIEKAATWKKISLGPNIGEDGKKFDGSPGKAEMQDADVVGYLVPTQSGVLVLRHNVGGIGFPANGVAYLKGQYWYSAWSNEGKAHLAADTNDKMLVPGVYDRGGFEYPILFDGQNEIGHTSYLAASFNPCKLSTEVKAKGNNGEFAGLPLVASHNSTLLIVDNNGVHAKDSVGADLSKSFVMDAAVKVTAIVTNQVEAIALPKTPSGLLGNKLYVGFHDNGFNDNSGGVAVCEIKGSEVTCSAVDASWNKLGVKEFAVDHHEVWALTENSTQDTVLYKVAADGKKGDKLAAVDEPKDHKAIKNGQIYSSVNNLTGKNLPNKNITGAVFIRGNLVLSISDRGIIYGVSSDKSVDVQ